MEIAYTKNCLISAYQLFINMPIIIWFSADVSIFKPSSFYIVIQAHLVGLRLEIQLVPLMQLYITVNSAYQGETCGIYLLQTFNLILSCNTLDKNSIKSIHVHVFFFNWILFPILFLLITNQCTGLCGNFNKIEADDFTTIGGLREATALDFANTWKTRASCPDVKRNFENPCSLSTENGMNSLYWCDLIYNSGMPLKD